MRYRRALAERLEGARSVLKGSIAKQRVCPACRALVGAGESRCPFCNERLTALDRAGVRRMFSSLMPGGMRYSSIILLVNFVLFAIALLATMRAGVGLQSLFGTLPAPVLVALGARDYHVLLGEVWRLVTAMFLHANLIHLAFNSLVLFDLGPAVEELYGRHRFLVLYFVTGVSGSVFSALWHPYVIMVGASGALFGLIGVMIAYGYRNRTSMGEAVKAMYIRWAIYGLLFGFFIGADNAAHIGGLVAGVAFGMIVPETPSFSRGAILAWKTASHAVVVAILLCFILVGLQYGRWAM